jgi:flagellar basal-body rod modification protein FlgD
MTTVTNTATSAATSATSATANTNKSTSVTDASDRFLKLLVTQMQNQDPLNPMDNAQVTSQMAQINTVTGIEKLNTTMGTMSTNFTQMQMLQGVSLVGHGVLLEGNQLAADADGNAVGAYELSGSAGKVAIEIKSAAGKVIDTVQAGAQSSGQHGFSWTPPEGSDLTGMTFNVKATAGSTAIGSTNLMSDVVDAVRTDASGLTVHLRNNGETPYSKVKTLS